MGVTYDGLERLEVDHIPAGGSILEEFENGIADDLSSEFLDPEKMVDALKLLGDLGQDGDFGTSIILAEHEGRNPFSVTL